MSTRKAVFDVVAAARGRGFTQGEVDKLDAVLDDLGVPRDRAAPKTLSSPVKFFSSIRASLFDGSLDESQVQGINAKLAAFGAAGWPLAYAANAFATSYLETAKTMQPVREAYWLSENWRKNNLRYYPHYGRGDVQLTWERNYEKANKKLHEMGVLKADEDLTRDLDLALRPDVSAAIMVYGMEEGWFTGKKLGDYLPSDRPATHAEHKSARPIINGTDRDDDLADYAIRWQAALQSGGWV